MDITAPDIPLTDERRDLCEAVREFVARDVRPSARESERNRFPEDVWERLVDLGLTGLTVPEEYGGLDADRITSAIVHEEIARGELAISVALAAHALATACIAEFGTPDVREEWLPDMADGRPVGAFCLSEPQAGSNPAEMTTTASAEGDEFVLTGTKQWVSNGERAGVYIVFAKLDSASDEGITQFLVPADSEGVRVKERHETLGVRACETVEMTFEEVRLPKRYRLTERGKGLSAAFQILVEGRIASAAQSVGLGRAAFEDAREYAGERKKSGKPLTESQAVRHKFADMATEIHAARLLVREAARRADVGASDETAASMAKYFASETAVSVTNEAMQIHGADGALREYDVERLYRDAKATTIYEGTSEIQKEIIARDVSY